VRIRSYQLEITIRLSSSTPPATYQFPAVDRLRDISKPEEARGSSLQKSKGSLICTAALELSSNQVTHFYSKKKETNEMIRMLEALLEKYKDEDRIFLSWDAASWHMSRALNFKVDRVNDDAYRQNHGTPRVQLAPLPVGAQFLNVIESVFSGMARAVIHNSDYQSIDECKQAIDRYFKERNAAYLRNPKRAGKKIWGNERIEPIFNEANNCKDPDWR
jgi:DDE superfamily endonuclease